MYTLKPEQVIEKAFENVFSFSFSCSGQGMLHSVFYPPHFLLVYGFWLKLYAVLCNL